MNFVFISPVVVYPKWAVYLSFIFVVSDKYMY